MPGDKSISHRALMLSAIATGQSRITGFLHSTDTAATMVALKAMGVDIRHISDGEVSVAGVGKNGLSEPATALDVGNSGTSARLLAGLLAGMGVSCELVGDSSLMLRPMDRIVQPLKEMRAQITCSAAGTLPILIKGNSNRLQGIDFTMPVASAQLKSSILLAGLNATGKTSIHEPVRTRDHTERMLREFSCQIENSGNSITLAGGQTLQGTKINVPGDISSAAFFIVGACIAKDSDIIIEGVGINPYRDAVLRILRAMGADIEQMNQRVLSGESVADIRVRSAQLSGIDIPTSWVPAAIDELPVIMIAAACAKGVTNLSGATELRLKESDRITAMTLGLSTLGIDVKARADGMVITGGRITGGEIDSFSDHRIAMAFSMAGLNAVAPVTIKDCANVATSFPGFPDLARQAGLDLTVQGSDA